MLDSLLAAACLARTLEALAFDEVYQGYVLLHYQAAAARAERYAAKLRELGIDVDDV